MANNPSGFILFFVQNYHVHENIILQNDLETTVDISDFYFTLDNTSTFSRVTSINKTVK